MNTEKDNAIIHTCCIECKKNFDITVNVYDYLNWKQGTLIHRAFPYLSAEQREILISGYCGECFDKVFAWMGNEEDY